MAEVAEGLPRASAISSCVSLGIMVLDFAWLFRDEVKFIWPKVRCRERFALVYIVARYAGMGGHIFNVYFSLRIASGVVTPPALCILWFRYQAVTIQLLLAAVEISWMHRIYTLFRKNHWILALLIILGIAQLLSMVISARLALPNMSYSSTCYVTRPHAASAYFGATTMTTNLAILFMISWRYLKLPVPKPTEIMKYEAIRAILRVVLRDSALSIVSLVVLTLVMMLANMGAIELSLNGNIIYHWLFCVLWMSFGRVTVNHAKVVQEQIEKFKRGDPNTLTLVEIGETSTWSSSSSISSSHRSELITDSVSHSHSRPDIVDFSGLIEAISLNILGVTLTVQSSGSLAETGSLHTHTESSSKNSEDSKRSGVEVEVRKQIENENSDKKKGGDIQSEDKDCSKGVPLVTSDSREAPDKR